MSVLLGLYHTILAVLLVSGVAKLAMPTPAADAMAAARILPARMARSARFRTAAARLLGSFEAALALVALVGPRAGEGDARMAVGAGAAAVVGLAYLGFVWFLGRLARLDATAECGCFGADPNPPGPAHVVADLGAATIAFSTAIGSAATGQSAGLDGIDGLSLTLALPYLTLVVVASFLFIAVPSGVSALRDARSPNPAGHRRAIEFHVSESPFR
jgi:hypothetical protein